MTAHNDRPPWRRTSALVELEITGCISPFDEHDQPVLLQMPCTDDRFMAVFSSKAKLLQLLLDYPLPRFAKLKRIDNGPEFVASLIDNGHAWLRLIVDPYKHTNGLMRFVEVPLHNPLPSPT